MTETIAICCIMLASALAGVIIGGDICNSLKGIKKELKVLNHFVYLKKYDFFILGEDSNDQERKTAQESGEEQEGAKPDMTKHPCFSICSGCEKNVMFNLKTGMVYCQTCGWEVPKDNFGKKVLPNEPS